MSDDALQDGLHGDDTATDEDAGFDPDKEEEIGIEDLDDMLDVGEKDEWE